MCRLLYCLMFVVHYITVCCLLCRHVRFSSNMSEMLQCGVQLVSSLLDDVSKEAVESEPRILVWQEFSLIGQYSCLAQLSCLNRSVPVVDMLLGVAESSCKRVCVTQEGRRGKGKGGGGRWREREGRWRETGR